MKQYLDKALRYRRVHGTRKLFTEIIARIQAGRAVTVGPGVAVRPTGDGGWFEARALVEARHRATRPLPLFQVPHGPPRLSVVTDSINAGSLYGGVGTALLLAALVAEAANIRLRVVTRTERSDPSNFQGVLALYGVALPQDVDFAYAPVDEPRRQIDVVPGERFLTTSWWTTAATLGSVPAESVTYLLQEDERMFYPFGDDHLRASELLARRDLRVIVNTKLLLDHLVSSGLPHLAETARSFEPAFPPAVFHPRTAAAGGKRTLLFYARPNNARNLFLFGLEILEAAITRGLLDLRAWDVVFVGKDIPKVRLDDGRYVPRRLEYLSWSDYADLAGRTDLALSLMYSPHPSYPPLDLAASGAVVVTNRQGLKQDLSAYSANIICGDPDLASMLAAFEAGIALAGDAERRTANHRANGLGTDWRVALAPVVHALARLD